MRAILTLSFLTALFWLLCVPAIAETSHIGFDPASGMPAPPQAEYFVLTLDSTLTAERQLVFSTPQFAVTDAGPNSTYTVGLGSILNYFYGTGATTNQAALNAFTNIAGRATGDIFYWDGTNYTRLPIGSASDVLTVSGGLPSWSASASGAPTNAQYILGANDATLTQDRAWTDGSGITHTDGGANGAWTVAVDSTVIRTTGAQSMSGPKTLSGGPIISGATSTGLVLAGSSFNDTIVITDPAAARTLTIPDPGANASFIMSQGAQTKAGVLTLSSSPVLSTNTVTGSGANTVTFFTSSDTVVGRATTDTLTSKTLTSPDFSNNATGFRMLQSSGNYTHSWNNPTANRTLTWTDPNGNVDVAYKSGTCTAGGIAYGIGNNTVSVTSAGTSGLPVLSGGAGAPTIGVLGISGGGTNNGSLGVSALGIYNGDGSKVVQTTGTAGQSWRVNAGGTAVEAFTPGTGTVTSVAQSLTSLGFMSISGSPVTTSGTLALAASGTTGDTIYFSGSNATSKLGIGSAGNIYTVASGVPSWATPSGFHCIKRKASDTSRASTTTVSDDPDLLFAVGANEVWDFTAIINFTETNATPDLKYTFAGPSGSTVTFAGAWYNVNSGLSALIAGTAGGTTNTVDFVTAAAPLQLVISGKCTNGATPGNLSFQWAQNVSNANNVTAITGSYLQGIRE